MNAPTLEIELASQPIELCKLLKAVDLVSGGGEAKMVISDGYVAVNGELETQKRKKIYHNDHVEFNGECILVICHAPIEVKPIKKAKESAVPASNAFKSKPSTHKNNRKQAKKNPATNAKKTQPNEKPINDNSGKRKPINF